MHLAKLEENQVRSDDNQSTTGRRSGGAADVLNIKKEKSGFDAGWKWTLAEDAHADCEEAHSRDSEVSTFETPFENKGHTPEQPAEDAHPQCVSTYEEGDPCGKSC
jgi:hypothetical protein